MRTVITLGIALLAASIDPRAADREVKALVTIGVQSAIEALAPLFEKASGTRIVATWSTSALLNERIRGGEQADLLISTRAGIDGLIKEGRVAQGSDALVARSGIGVAVRRGAPKPDISTPDTLRRAVQAARAISYSDPAAGGVSGVHFASVLERLGIAAEMRGRTKFPPPSGFSAQLLASGEVDLAVQQIPELLSVAGTELVGPLPGDLQLVTTFAAGIPASATEGDAARAFIRFLATPEAQAVMRAKGLESAQSPAAATAPQGPAQFSREWYQQFSGPYSAPVEPFRIVGNIHYVGGANIASYLITTPQGHILIDTGMNEMHDVIAHNVAALGFKTADIRIMLSSHAHFDHIEGHAAMQRLTGAQVMAMEGDAEALESGKDNSALGAIGWEPVKVHRVLSHNSSVSLGGTTLRALHTAGHTRGATTWITTVSDGGRQYLVAFLGGTTPNGGIPLLNNPRHRNVIDDTRRTFARLKAQPAPDIFLVGHPQAMFAGVVERLKAGATPHPLLNGAVWTKQLADGEAAFEARVAAERAAGSR